jgi:tellurite resistance protein TehA-like permease
MRIARWAATLPPAAFSIVMATGIVSTATHLFGLRPVAWILLALNILAYVALATLTLLRLFVAPDRMRAEFGSHATAPGFFTLVAGTSVLGSQFILLAARPMIALVLWVIGIILWLLLIYAFFTIMSVGTNKPPLEEGLNGGWMLVVVATQSISLLGTLLVPEIPLPSHTILGFTTTLFLLGCIFYILLFSLILYRLLFFHFDPENLHPPYWINMGAVAITTLAGSLLIIRADSWIFLQEILPFLKGFTLLFWSTATWWIPLILVLGIWRHIVHSVPLRYDIQYWSMVFPLGMYAVATLRLTQALGWTGLRPLAWVFGYIALVAWVVTAVGLLRHIWRGGSSWRTKSGARTH